MNIDEVINKMLSEINFIWTELYASPNKYKIINDIISKYEDIFRQEGIKLECKIKYNNFAGFGRTQKKYLQYCFRRYARTSLCVIFNGLKYDEYIEGGEKK